MDDAARYEQSGHLWIPVPEENEQLGDPIPSSSRAPQLVRERLYVGNLSPAVDEYTLLQVFTKFGKIAKLDFLFHKAGLNKGRPRGYAFVEFTNEADAAKALQTANGKLLRGRKLVVTLAQQASSHEGSTSFTGRTKRTDATPTALSLAKSSGVARPEAKTSSKIAMMEAKLRQMASSSPYSERPALPIKPSGLHKGPSEGIYSHRSGSLLARSVVSKAQGTRNNTSGGQSGCGPSTALPSIRDAEPPDTMRVPPSSKQRSIPGVKILKGASNKGVPGGTPSG